MRIRFKRMNFEAEFYYDMATGRGFLINDMPYADVDKSIRNEEGPRSPMYGTTYGDTNEFMDRYHCKCGKTVGAAFEGEVCPLCGTVIEFHEPSIDTTGWLNIEPFKIISPLYFFRMQSALSKKILDDIINSENIIDANGIIRKKDDVIEVKKSVLKYHNVGLWEFYQHYEEIMEYYKTKRKAKAELIDSLIRDKDIVWTSKIPVYSTVLRPSSVTTESFYFHPIDKEVVPMTNISINLKKAADIEIPPYLYQFQQKAINLFNINFELINGKKGWVRGQVLGGSFNYSSQ